MRRVPTEAELEEAAGGITYRIDQTIGSILALRPGQFLAIDPATAQVIGNDLIEASLSFCRVLAYFLSNEGEVKATEYLDGWTKGDVTLDKATAIGAVSDHVAHAKFVPKRSWPLADIARELIDGFTVFVDKLASSSHPNRAEWFRGSVRRADQQLAALGVPPRSL